MGSYTTRFIRKLLHWGRSSTLAFTLGACSLSPALLADEPGPNANSRVSDSFILLSNGSVLHGKATRIGEHITVSRESSQIRLSSQQVAHIGTSLDNLYQFRISNRIPGDLRQLKHDIRWSLHNGLIRRAAEDVLQARTLNSQDPEVVHLLRMVAAEMRPDPQPTTNPSPIQRVSYDQVVESKNTADAVPPHNLSEENFHAFITRVQPILMNRCAGCHSTEPENETSLKLRSAMEATWAPKRTAARNLASVMQFVDLHNLSASTLRHRAMDGHGGARKSFGKPSSPMMQRLDAWLSGLSQQETSTQSSPRPVNAPPQLSELGMQTQSERRVMNEGIDASEETKQQTPSKRKTLAQGEPSLKRMPKVSNPFDPDLFNRHFHR